MIMVLVVMPMDNQLVKRLVDPVDHYTCTSRSGYGAKTFGAPISRSCYREGKISTVKNAKGEEVISSFRLYFNGLIPITVDDKFVWDAKDYPVLAYSTFRGLVSGTGTTVVYV